MDMKVDSQKLIQLRNARAWSQQHLADVSGLSLRTIQRIEKTQSVTRFNRRTCFSFRNDARCAFNG